MDKIDGEIMWVTELGSEENSIKKAAEKAGFSFTLHRRIELGKGKFEQIVFTCVCGKTEYASAKIHPWYARGIFSYLHRKGSFSKQHLLGDGYNEVDAEQISRIFEDGLR